MSSKLIISKKPTVYDLLNKFNLFDGVYFKLEKRGYESISMSGYITLYSQTELKMIYRTRHEIESFINEGYRIYQICLKNPGANLKDIFILEEFGIKVKYIAIESVEEYDYKLIWDKED